VKLFKNFKQINREMTSAFLRYSKMQKLYPTDTGIPEEQRKQKESDVSTQNTLTKIYKHIHDNKKTPYKI